MITYEGDTRHVDQLLRDYGFEHRGRTGEKTVPWNKPAFLAKDPLEGPSWPVDQARSFKQPMHGKLVHCDRIDQTFGSHA